MQKIFLGHEVEYGTYVAPGLLAYTSFSSSFFEGLYGSYIRMFYQKTWDGMLGTQLELRHILWGEIIWAGCRGGMNATVVMVVLFIFHSLDLTLSAVLSVENLLHMDAMAGVIWIVILDYREVGLILVAQE